MQTCRKGNWADYSSWRRGPQCQNIQKSRKWTGKRSLAKDGGKPCQNIFHDGLGHTFQAFALQCPHIQGAGLVAANQARGACAAAIERYCESGCAGNIAVCDWQDNGNLRAGVESVGRHYQHETVSLKFMPCGRIRAQLKNISAPHQTSSLPTGRDPVHVLSSSERGADASHWSSNSSRLYFFPRSGSIIRRPVSTAMLTLSPDFSCRMSRIAGGRASMVEPPTFLKVPVYMMNITIFARTTVRTYGIFPLRPCWTKRNLSAGPAPFMFLENPRTLPKQPINAHKTARLKALPLDLP